MWPTRRRAARTREIVQAVLELHASGFERILGHLAAAGDAGAAVLDDCTSDEIVTGLLLLHGLHPLDQTSRVLQALEQIRPTLAAHGGDVELLESGEGTVRLRLKGSCHGCPSSSITMKQTIEEAILARAPDVITLEVEGLTPEPAVTPDGRPLVSLTVL